LKGTLTSAVMLVRFYPPELRTHGLCSGPRNPTFHMVHACHHCYPIVHWQDAAWRAPVWL